MPRRLLIAPSILSADFAQLGTQIHEVEAAGADWIHVDVMDGHFVPNLSMGPVVVEACRRVTRLPLDVHLMVEQPAFRAFARRSRSPRFTSKPTRAWIVVPVRELAAICLPQSTSSSHSPRSQRWWMVLVMSVNPGYSGQQFMEAVCPRSARCKWIDEGKDGVIESMGIDPPLFSAGAGAEVFVAAKAVFGHPQGIQAGVHALREALALAHA
jgi:ribulose-phosphate 3-epimerase